MSINKRTLFIIASLLVVSIILAIIRSSLNKNSDNEVISLAPLPLPTTHTPNQETKVAYGINLTKQDQIPPTLNLYSVAAPINQNQTLLLEQLGFPPESKQPDVDRTQEWLNTTIGRFTLTPQKSTTQISFLSHEPPPEKPIENSEAAWDIARSYAAAIHGLEKEAVLPQTVQYLRANEYNAVPENSPNRANIIQYTYALILDSKPFISNLNPPQSGTISINSNNKIQSFSAIKTSDPQVQSTPPTISINKALEILRQNEGYLASAVSNTTTETTIEPNYARATINRHRLIYSLIPDTNLIAPFHEFTGTAPHTTKRGVIFSIVYLVPAVAGM
jgi:hypothetical protein